MAISVWKARLWKFKWWLALAAALAVLAVWLRCGPLPHGFLDQAPHRSVRVLDRQGRLLYESLSEKEMRSSWLAPDSLPPALVQATLAAEDHRFYRHFGVDPIALARALWVDARARRLKEGGSTLTEQVVKQIAARKRTVAGKLREMVFALRLEHRLGKKEILALYLNLAPYGNEYAGAQAAAMGYFGCPAANLTAAQAAFLAGLPQRPSTLDPYRNLAGAVRRQREVLSRMRRLGALDEAEFRRAMAEKLSFRRTARPFRAPHFVQKVLREAGEGAPAVLRTTLDLDMQREVEDILAARREDLEHHGAHAAAVVVLENATGQWLAWEGSGGFFDPRHGGANDGASTPRQPGSALKPFTYALAFERGFTPATVLPDVPSHFPTAEAGVLYSPRNYDGAYRGPLRARQALAGSENVPAVWLVSQVGVAPLLDLLRGLGVTTLGHTADYYGYGLTLGDPEVRLDELAAAYATLARGGLARLPRSILGGSPDSPARRVLSERAAYWVTDILSDNASRAYVFGRGGSLEFPFPVAAKTGTSQAYRDNWTLGYTREMTVGVWVGNFDGSPLKGSSGVTGAGPIFHDVLLAAQKRAGGASDLPLQDHPPDLVPVRVCALSGQRASEACPESVAEWLDPKALPPVCRWHLREGRSVKVSWPVEYREWAERFKPGEDAGRAPPAAQRSRALTIASPPEGASYWIDPTLHAEFQTLELRALAVNPAEMISWTLDGRTLGERPANKPLRWAMTRGEHVLAASDHVGHSAEAKFTVK